MRNFLGEIDLIALRGKSLVFIEVKGRKNLHDNIVLKTQQQKRIRRAAEMFIAHNPKYYGYDMRFDLVLIRPYKFPVIITNAW